MRDDYYAGLNLKLVILVTNLSVATVTMAARYRERAHPLSRARRHTIWPFDACVWRASARSQIKSLCVQWAHLCHAFVAEIPIDVRAFRVKFTMILTFSVCNTSIQFDSFQFSLALSLSLCECVCCGLFVPFFQKFPFNRIIFCVKVCAWMRMVNECNRTEKKTITTAEVLNAFQNFFAQSSHWHTKHLI